MIPELKQFLKNRHFEHGSVIIKCGNAPFDISEWADGCLLFTLPDGQSLDAFCDQNNIRHINLLYIQETSDFQHIIESAKVILTNIEYIYSRYETKAAVAMIGPERWRRIEHFLLCNDKFREAFITDTGAWTLNDSNEHVFDYKLCDKLIAFFKKNAVRSIYDFGCGEGHYVNALKDAGFDVKGFDGNPQTEIITNLACSVLDLSENIRLPQKAEWILSLEVGEHIPKKFEKTFISNLVNNSTKGIILSWAIPGQGGFGHVNCQTNEYIKGMMKEFGFVNMKRAEDTLRLAAKSTWFKKTIMVFKRDDGKV